MADLDWWDAPAARGPLDATVALPGSKSQTARALILGAVGVSPLEIRRPLASRDTVLAARALEHLGVAIDAAGHSVRIVPPATVAGDGHVIDCGLAGTVMRFVPAIAAFGQATVTFDGDEAARSRPVRPLLDALERLGATVRYLGEPGFLPFSITGAGPRGLAPRVELDSSQSSQYLTALLLASCLAPAPFVIDLVGTPPSAAHIDMTVAMMAAQGVPVERLSAASYRVGGRRPNSRPIDIEPDLSNAGPFLAASLICGGTVRIADWPQRSTQAGDAWRSLIPLFGGSVTESEGSLAFSAPAGGRWHGVTLDLGEIGELTPTVAALCALADSPSELVGIGHLRGHETNRLEALATEIRRCGADARVLDDGLRIIPGELRAARFESYADHRMATFGALMGLALPGSAVRDIGTTAKTLPDFPSRWLAMLAGEPSPAIPDLASTLTPLPTSDGAIH